MHIQKLLDNPYKGDINIYLRDILLTAVNIPSIQDSILERVPRTSHHLINSVGNRLSDRPKTDGFSSALHINEEADED